MASNQLQIRPADGADAQPVEIIEQAIIDIARSMKELSNSRLTRRAIIVLIQADTRLNKGEIETVLTSLEQMERTWLKPKKN